MQAVLSLVVDGEILFVDLGVLLEHAVQAAALAQLQHEHHRRPGGDHPDAHDHVLVVELRLGGEHIGPVSAEASSRGAAHTRHRAQEGHQAALPTGAVAGMVERRVRRGDDEPRRWLPS